MIFKNLFKRIVDENKVSFIIKEFISKQDIKILAYHKITKRGIVEIHTDRPGVFIGRNGINIKSLKYRMKKECNVKDIMLYELKRNEIHGYIH